MDKTEKKPSFAKMALLAWLAFLLVFIGFSICKVQKNMYIADDIVPSLFGAFCLLSIPWWLFAATIWMFMNKKKWWHKTIVIVVMVVALIFAGNLGMMLTTISLESVTTSVSDYLVMDKGVQMPETAQALFPAAVPQHAEKALYSYRCGQTQWTVQACWTLPEDEYLQAVEDARLVLDGAASSETENGENVLSMSMEMEDQTMAQVYFLFSDEEHAVEYGAYRGQKE